MKKITSRRIFDFGLDLLKTLICVGSLILLLKYLAYQSFGITLSSEVSLNLFLILYIAFLIYDFLSALFLRLSNKAHQTLKNKEKKEAICVLEKNHLKVAVVLVDPPKEEVCYQAITTLTEQNLPFITIDSNGEATCRLYFIGEYGLQNHDTYKLKIERILN